MPLPLHDSRSAVTVNRSQLPHCAIHSQFLAGRRTLGGIDRRHESDWSLRLSPVNNLLRSCYFPPLWSIAAARESLPLLDGKHCSCCWSASQRLEVFLSLREDSWITLWQWPITFFSGLKEMQPNTVALRDLPNLPVRGFHKVQEIQIQRSSLIWGEGRGMQAMSWTRPCHGLDWSHSLFYLTLLLWTRRMNGLADFSSKMMMMQ